MNCGGPWNWKAANEVSNIFGRIFNLFMFSLGLYLQIANKEADQVFKIEFPFYKH